MWVRVARKVAGLGYHAVRFDLHGSGESTGEEERLRLDRPFIDDLAGAVRWVEGHGVSDFLLVGSCYGARAALSFAPRVQRLRGVVLATTYLSDMRQGERLAVRMAAEWTLGRYLRRALSPRVLRGWRDRDRRRTYATVARTKWREMSSRMRPGGQYANRVGPSFLEPLEGILDRDVPVLFLYGDQDDSLEDFERARAGSLGEILTRAGQLAEVAVLPGKVHAFSTVRVQEAAMERIIAWLAEQRVNARGG
jgi:pimeloyl-ACP methyl ester carboxylesterase